MRSDARRIHLPTSSMRECAVLALLIAASLPMDIVLARDDDRSTESADLARSARDATTDRQRPAETIVASTPRSLDVTDKVVRAAIIDSGDANGDVTEPSRRAFGRVPSGQVKVDRAFKDAEIPSCMTTDAFKFDPLRIGPFTVIAPKKPVHDLVVHEPFVYDIRLLFLAHAVLSGACRH
jgi:hypothetical protein